MTLPLTESYLEIPLSKGLTAIVDADDYDMLTEFPWYALYSKCTKSSYAATKSKRGTHRMHRLVMGCRNGDGTQVDHINGNTLDNRKNNLRLVTHSQNSMNSKLRCSSISGYRGVSFCAKTGKWKSRVQVQNKVIWLGRFSSKEDAISAAEVCRKEVFGEFARSYR